MTNTKTGRELRAALARAGLTQYQLAVALGVAPSKVSAFANGHLAGPVATELAGQIEARLGMTPGVLSGSAT